MITEGARLAELAIAVRHSTLRRLRQVPADTAQWRPDAGALSPADIARHLRIADGWLLEKASNPSLSGIRAATGEADGRGSSDYPALVQRLERSGERRAGWLLTLSDERLATTVPDDRFDAPATLWWIIVRGNLDHEAHHRGQLATYLRLLGVET